MEAVVEYLNGTEALEVKLDKAVSSLDQAETFEDYRNIVEQIGEVTSGVIESHRSMGEEAANVKQPHERMLDQLSVAYETLLDKVDEVPYDQLGVVQSNISCLYTHSDDEAYRNEMFKLGDSLIKNKVARKTEVNEQVEHVKDLATELNNDDVSYARLFEITADLYQTVPNLNAFQSFDHYKDEEALDEYRQAQMSLIGNIAARVEGDKRFTVSNDELETINKIRKTVIDEIQKNSGYFTETRTGMSKINLTVTSEIDSRKHWKDRLAATSLSSIIDEACTAKDKAHVLYRAVSGNLGNDYCCMEEEFGSLIDVIEGKIAKIDKVKEKKKFDKVSAEVHPLLDSIKSKFGYVGGEVEFELDFPEDEDFSSDKDTKEVPQETVDAARADSSGAESTREMSLAEIEAVNAEYDGTRVPEEKVPTRPMTNAEERIVKATSGIPQEVIEEAAVESGLVFDRYARGASNEPDYVKKAREDAKDTTDNLEAVTDRAVGSPDPVSEDSEPSMDYNKTTPEEIDAFESEVADMFKEFEGEESDDKTPSDNNLYASDDVFEDHNSSKKARAAFYTMMAAAVVGGTVGLYIANSGEEVTIPAKQDNIAYTQPDTSTIDTNNMLAMASEPKPSAFVESTPPVQAEDYGPSVDIDKIAREVYDKEVTEKSPIGDPTKPMDFPRFELEMPDLLSKIMEQTPVRDTYSDKEAPKKEETTVPVVKVAQPQITYRNLTHENGVWKRKDTGEVVEVVQLSGGKKAWKLKLKGGHYPIKLKRKFLPKDMSYKEISDLIGPNGVKNSFNKWHRPVFDSQSKPVRNEKGELKKEPWYNLIPLVETTERPAEPSDYKIVEGIKASGFTLTGLARCTGWSGRQVLDHTTLYKRTKKKVNGTYTHSWKKVSRRTPYPGDKVVIKNKPGATCPPSKKAKAKKKAKNKQSKASKKKNRKK